MKMETRRTHLVIFTTLLCLTSLLSSVEGRRERRPRQKRQHQGTFLFLLFQQNKATTIYTVRIRISNQRYSKASCTEQVVFIKHIGGIFYTVSN